MTAFRYSPIRIGVTAGCHRLYSHRSYNASIPLQYFLAMMSAEAAEHTAAWWATRHRAHHRYMDTDLDPYGTHRDLFWSHIGWLLVKPRYKPPVDASDLLKDPVPKWQHKY
ncbi:hypothetical protein M422DRAFT_165212 [Sphaerobolus stellatus SS14]|nr:hypothetical protein M422DRAFT_165212 [Sphaerobolus stellatus SS14]